MLRGNWSLPGQRGTSSAAQTHKEATWYEQGSQPGDSEDPASSVPLSARTEAASALAAAGGAAHFSVTPPPLWLSSGPAP